MLVPVSMIPSTPWFSCGKKQSERRPHAHLHPMETGIWLQIFTPSYLSCSPAVTPPSLPFTAILLSCPQPASKTAAALGSVSEPGLQRHISIGPANLWPRVTKIQNKNFHTQIKLHWTGIKDFPFSCFMKSLCIFPWACLAWSCMEVHQSPTNRAKHTLSRHSGRKEQSWRGQAGLAVNTWYRDAHKPPPVTSVLFQWAEWKQCQLPSQNTSGSSARRGFLWLTEANAWCKDECPTKSRNSDTWLPGSSQSREESWLHPPMHLLPWRLQSTQKSSQLRAHVGAEPCHSSVFITSYRG